MNGGLDNVREPQLQSLLIFISRVECNGSDLDVLTVLDLQSLHHSRVHRVQVDGEGEVGAGVDEDLGDLEGGSS